MFLFPFLGIFSSLSMSRPHLLFNDGIPHHNFVDLLFLCLVVGRYKDKKLLGVPVPDWSQICDIRSKKNVEEGKEEEGMKERKRSTTKSTTAKQEERRTRTSRI